MFSPGNPDSVSDPEVPTTSPSGSGGGGVTVSSVSAAPVTVAMLFNVSVAVTDVVSGPSASVVRSSVTVPSALMTPEVTVALPSLTVITAVASASSPARTKSTASTSVASISRSGAVSARLPSASAEVSGTVLSSVSALPVTVALLPEPSDTVIEVVSGPSASVETSRLIVPLVPIRFEVTLSTPSDTVTIPVASGSRPDTVRATLPISEWSMSVSGAVSERNGASSAVESMMVSSVRVGPAVVVVALPVSVATICVITGPSSSEDMSSVTDPSAPITPDDTVEMPSLAVTMAVASPSSPEMSIVTVSASAASIWISGAVSTRLRSSSAEGGMGPARDRVSPGRVRLSPLAVLAVIDVVIAPSAMPEMSKV